MSYDIKDIMNDKAFEPYIEGFREHYDRYFHEQQYDYNDVLLAHYNGFIVASNGNGGVGTPLREVVDGTTRKQ